MTPYQNYLLVTYISQFTFKTQPEEGYISTIESVYYLLQEFREENLLAAQVSPKHIDNLMILFNKMVNFQLKKENTRIEQGIPDRYQNSYKFKRNRQKNC